MPTYISRSAVREVDRRAIEDFGLPGVVLMENAARGCVDWLLELGVHGRVVICAGKGNNGGDGFVMARHLAIHGIDVLTILFADPSELRGDAAINFHVLQRAAAPLVLAGLNPDLAAIRHELATADWIVDALLGTGTTGRLKSPYAELIRLINDSGKKVFAVDLPSGMDCDTGEPVDPIDPVCIRAHVTATFVALKQGFQNPRSTAFTGEVRVIDIGVPRQLVPSSVR